MTRWLSHTLLARLLTIAAAPLLGCGTPCGDGTYEVGGQCVSTSAMLKCGIGFQAIGDRCEPNPDWIASKCGQDTEYDPATRTCKGVGGSKICDKVCTPAPGKSCITGQAYDWMSWYKKQAGLGEAVPIKASDNVVLRLYAYQEFFTSASPTPVANGTTSVYNDNGCFMFKDVDPPFPPIFLLYADDDPAAGTQDNYAYFASAILLLNGVPAQIEASALVMPNTQLAEWGNDMLSKGSILALWRTQTGKGLEGAIPTQNNQPPPWPAGEVFFFKDPITPPYFEPAGATKTTANGLFVMRGIPMGSYSGEKTGCTFITGLFASYPGRLAFVDQTITCQ